MDWHADDEPSDDAYGRVTDAARYQSLHRVAAELIERLVAEYRLERHDGVDLDRRASPTEPAAPATMLVPLDGGAPITITFTSFPGVVVRFGHNWRDSFPACGCDAWTKAPVRRRSA